MSHPCPVANPFALPADFQAAADPATAPGGPAWWFGFYRSQLLLDGQGQVPQLETLETLALSPVRTQYLGRLAGRACYGAELAEPPPGLTLAPLRSLYGQLDETLFALAGQAVQLMEWDRTHQYCGSCGTPMEQPLRERVKQCPRCQLRQYPRLSPAIIVLVSRGDEVLLARAPRFRPGMYSVLAGFVEPGESLEETVMREVREEVGIEIGNIRYFGSQPWPFPNSLMVGFTATYASGALNIDPVEIEAADWFKPDRLPPVPGPLSIARKLIDAFVAEHITADPSR